MRGTGDRGRDLGAAGRVRQRKDQYGGLGTEDEGAESRGVSEEVAGGEDWKGDGLGGVGIGMLWRNADAGSNGVSEGRSAHDDFWRLAPLVTSGHRRSFIFNARPFSPTGDATKGSAENLPLIFD